MFSSSSQTGIYCPDDYTGRLDSQMQTFQNPKTLRQAGR
jgi:hypothetical protein